MNDTVETVLTELLSAMGVEQVTVSRTEVAGQSIFSIEAQDARDLIGVRGETLQALDMIVKKICEKRIAPVAGEDHHFIVDVQGYRLQHIKDIQTKALMMAERARSFQYDVELSPMSGYERLIVHTTLQDAPQVKTESLGEGKGRRVVIKYVASA